MQKAHASYYVVGCWGYIVTCGWRVHEVKVDEVIDAQRLEQQHHVAQVGTLDLWHLQDATGISDSRGTDT